MSTTQNLTNPAVSNSGEVDSLLVEKFTGKLKERQIKSENLFRFFPVEKVVGTDMVSEKFMGGGSTLQVLAPGADPEGSQAQYEKNALRVDSMVLSRYTSHVFHEIQSDIENQRSKLAKMQGDEHAKMRDGMIAQQLIRAGLINTAEARGNKPRVDGQGFSKDVQVSDAQADDPNSILAALELTHEQMVTAGDFSDGLEPDGLICLMTWPEFNALRDAERIVNQDYVDYEGNTINGFVVKSLNLPVIPSNRFPRLNATAPDREAAFKRIHGKGSALLSNASNGFRYTANDEQVKAFAVIFNSEALLVGETMDIEGEIFRDPRSKSWFVDAWQSIGAIDSNWESVGVIRKGASSANADVTKRAKRKAKPVIQMAS